VKLDTDTIRKMKTWTDSYQYSTELNLPIKEVYSEIINKARNSKHVKIVSKSKNTIKLQSILKEWLMAPPLPKYRIELRLTENSQNSTTLAVKVLGNSLVTFFKYLGILMFIGGIIIGIVDPFENEGNELGSIFPFLFGPLLWTFILNFWNKSNIQRGHDETKNIFDRK